jgi:hypothetical protein
MVGAVSAVAAGISLAAVLLIVVSLHMSQSLRPQGKRHFLQDSSSPLRFGAVETDVSV